jgi:hypothetical protein
MHNQLVFFKHQHSRLLEPLLFISFRVCKNSVSSSTYVSRYDK